MKKIFKILIVIAILLIACILSLSYTINKNNNYQEKLLNRVKKYYPNAKIDYINYQDDYYIYTTKEEIIILDKNFKEITKEKKLNLKQKKDNYEIVYKKEKIVYEETIQKKDKIIYTYYDAKTGEKINSITMEKQYE